MIVIAMTSWKKRIDKVEKVIRSIFSNTVKPDVVYLTLSSDEFPGKEKDLPVELLALTIEFKEFKINWIKENTKCFKKIFPILKYLKDDDIIISADDDILFPVDLIESRISDFEKYGKKFQVSSNSHTSIGFDGSMKIVSAMSLFQKKMLKNWNKYVDDKIINTYNDDRTYLTLLWLNGYKNVGPSKWTVQELLKKYDMNLDDGITNTKKGCFGRAYDTIANIEFNKKTGKNIINSFGYWK